MRNRIEKFFLENKLLFLIVVLATILRFAKIDQVPPSLNWDEVSHGFNAYSLLTTGKDEWGVNFPLIFRAYGDYKLPIYIYLTVISEFFFGLTTFAVRLPSVLAGIGTVIFTYLLTKELFKKLEIRNWKLEIITSLLVAVEPWSLFLSRGAFEANLALFFFIAGMFYFLRGINNSLTSNNLLLTSVLFGLSVWTYNSYRIFTPLILIALFVIYRNELLLTFRKNLKLTTHFSLLIALFFLPMFFQLLNPIGQARYGNLTILDSGAINEINEERNSSEFSPFVSRLLFNKATYFTKKFTLNYFSHFSPRFLFVDGGKDYQFSVPGKGVLYPVNAIFIVLGIILLIMKRNKISYLVFSWLFLAPIPDSLTREAPHVLRSLTTLPLPMILSAAGLVWFISWSNKLLGSKDLSPSTWPIGWKKILIPRKEALYLAYVLFLAILTENYLVGYFENYGNNYSWSWQYGYRQVVKYIKENYLKYDKIIITKKYGEPHEFILFYWPWKPEEYQSDPNLIRFYQSNWYWVDRFDKFYFINDWDVEKFENAAFTLESNNKVDCSGNTGSCLLITGPGNFPNNWQKLETFNFLDGKLAFEVYEN